MEKELFLKALGLTSPWYIKEVSLDIEKERMDIYLDFQRGSKFMNEDGDMVTAEQTVEKTWKHLFFWQYPTYLHARVPKLKNQDGKVHMIDLPWARAESGFTLLFESMILELAKHMPLMRLSRQIKENDERIMRVITYYVDISHKAANYNTLYRGSIDETSTKKGHKYVSSFVNLDTGRVVALSEGKGKEAVEDLALQIETHGGSRENIQEISIDFSPAFTSGVYTSFPQATLVYDRFHFMQFVTKAVDEVRRRETKEYTFLKGSRYLWLKNPETLTEQQTLLLEDLKTKNQSLFMAYQMKENVKDFFKQTSREDAEQFLQTWCTWIDSSNIEPMKQVVKTIKSHWNGLLNYAETCINSGITEGVNSIIQTLKRRARGYSNFSNFKTMIYLKIGDFPILSRGITT